MKSILLIFILIAGLGLVGSTDAKTEQLNATSELHTKMANTCHKSFQFDGDGQILSRDLEVKCGKLIDQVQADGKHEVLSDGNGNFWVESK